MRILGIETSCDETAAAIVAEDAILSSVVASQLDTHGRYGGVVPELASREHLRAIVPVVREALGQANLSWSDLDAVAATSGPGLAGSLLVGLTYAKAIALAAGIPLIAVNHIEGHIHAVILEARQLGSRRLGSPQRAQTRFVRSRKASRTIRAPCQEWSRNRIGGWLWRVTVPEFPGHSFRRDSAASFSFQLHPPSCR